VHGKRLLTDKGFASAANREEVRKKGIKDGISHKASKRRPLRFSQRLFNKLIARKRFLIGQAFGTLKRKFGMTRSCYMTRIKVEAQLYLKGICFNLTKALRMICINV